MSFECNKNSKFMKLAIALAKRGKGLTAPNPCVGAVITKDGKIVGKGWHRIYGGPHAEVEAIKDAISKGKDLKGSTLWVTLEPCNHYGKTPPCTKAILECGIKEVNIGVLDPNPNVKGGGAEFLRSKGIKVNIDINKEECKQLIEDFIVWNTFKRPYIYLKLAQTLDGKIATREGDSKWISCEKSREFVHGLRARVDGVLIGGNTFFNDNPRLTPRIEKDEKKDPLAIIVTSRLPEAHADYFLISKRPEKTVFITSNSHDKKKIYSLEQRGITVLEAKKEQKDFSPTTIGQIPFFDLTRPLKWLFSEKKCYYILCEGGGFMAQSLVSSNIVDEIFLFISPIVIGDVNARPSFSGSTISKIQDAYKFNILDMKKMDRDVLLHLVPKKSLI